MKRIIAIFIFCVMLLSLSVSHFQVFAGTVGVEFIREGMFSGTKPGVGDWKYKGNISVVDGDLFFNDKSTSDNMLINYTEVQRSQNIKNTFYINFNLNLKTFSENKQFGLAYGLENFISTIGSPKSSFIYFEKIGSNYFVGINTYDEKGNEQKILDKTQLKNTVNVNNILVEVTILNDNSITLSIDKEVYFISTPTEKVGRVEGLIGFGQVGAGVKNIENEIYVKFNQLTNLYYDTPTAPRESLATFDNDEFNKNEWYVFNRRVNGSRGIVVEDGVLFFDGAGETSMFSTKHIYSNFELIFDVYGAKNTPDENGPFGASNVLCIAFGDGFAAYDENPSPVKNGTFFAFDAGRDEETGKRNRDTYAYISFDGKNTEVIRDIPAKYGFFNEDFDPTTKVRICITVIDGVLEIKMKLATEIEYETIYTHVYPNYYTPSGCIRLMANHNNLRYVKYNMPTNLKVDDIRLYNFDVDPSVSEVEFVSNKTKEIPDYYYEDTWSNKDLLDFTLGK